MKVSYVSDLHLEHWFAYGNRELENYKDAFSNKENSEVLILAGDILLAEAIIRFPFRDNNNGTDSKYEYLSRMFQEFIEYVGSKYDKVIYVPGNHEYYGTRFHKVYPALLDSFNLVSNSNVYVLDNCSHIYNGVLFIGTTLWTDMAGGSALQMLEAKEGMNDYRAITINRNLNYRKLSPEDTVNFHSIAKDFIKNQINLFSSGKKFKPVVITHHAPSWQSINEKYVRTKLNGAYVSDMDNFILDFPSISYWIHGHLHDPVDYKIGNTNIISNPIGYPNENYKSLNDIVIKTFEV